ncbi:MAG: GspE/PulE family protein [Planctomycetota bacterium]|jgi:type II secretory ATPase GspE/PulE/Tfp pilus assembly ATPase PilB-like protein
MISILASIPDDGGYINFFKVGAVVVLLFLWGLATQWVDRDTHVVKTKRQHWNMIVVSGGMVGFLVMFAVPWPGTLFAVGIAVWILLAGGGLLLYVLHRNGRVVPAQRVLTIGHLKRLLQGSGEKKRFKEDRGLRVRLEDHEGNFIERPSDPEIVEEFDAVQDFLQEVLWRRASDVEVRAGKEGHRVAMNVDGVVTERPEPLATETGERVVRFLKRIAGLNAEEIRRPQKGRISAALLSHNGDPGYTEVQSSGSTAGERLRLQINTGATLLRVPELGIPPQRLDSLKSILGRNHGLFIISSTPRNGASTTQYAILKSHDAYIHNIHTLERRSLLELDNITQQIYDGANTDVDYARVLQTVLRREPDIVLVADCDDRETAMVASVAAAQDRKIYLGLRARDCFDALGRFLKFLDDPELASKAVLGVMNQRLARKLCDDCREAYKPDEATLKKLNLPADKIERFYRPPSEKKFDKRGREIVCPACQGTGYNGRVPIFEIMVVDDTIRQMIAHGSPLKSIKNQARKNKMYYLQEEGLLKVIDGTTSMNEVLRVLRAAEK